MRYVILGALVVAAAGPLRAQNEAILRQAFEGKVVAVKIDMPATQKGVDVYPLDAMPVDFREVAQRLKDNSTSLRIGQQVMVTKVLVKKNSHIEFQLGGGGYGTLGDNTSDGSGINAVSQGETKAEKALRGSSLALRFDDDLNAMSRGKPRTDRGLGVRVELAAVEGEELRIGHCRAPRGEHAVQRLSFEQLKSHSMARGCSLAGYQSSPFSSRGRS